MGLSSVSARNELPLLVWPESHCRLKDLLELDGGFVSDGRVAGASQWLVLDYDWYGQRLAAAVQFVVAIDDERLVAAFWCRQQPDYDCSLARGSFVEGLWQRDCVEVFLSHGREGGYLEFNLAPSGAYWAAAFDGPRQRRSGAAVDGQAGADDGARSDAGAGAGGGAGLTLARCCETMTFVEAESWRAAIAIPRALWAGDGACSEQRRWWTGLRGNVTAIVNGRAGAERRSFTSWARLSAEEPDFHRPDEFVPLVVGGERIP